MLKRVYMSSLRLFSKHRLAEPNQPGSQPYHCKARIEILSPYIARGTIGAEIGVLKGSFIDYLLQTQPEKLYCVDPWYRLTSNWSWAVGNQSTVTALVNLLQNFKKEIGTGQLEPRVEFSIEFLQSLQDDSLDWVYIDASHDYNETIAELELALKKVKASGYILGDDYDPDPGSAQYGVYKAVNKMVDNGKMELIVAGKSRQFVAKRLEI